MLSFWGPRVGSGAFDFTPPRLSRDWFGFVSGLSRDWLGSLSQKFRLELDRNWFEIVSGFSRERLGEVGDGFRATFVVYSTYSPLLRRISMCSEWGLLALARCTYSSKCPLDISRCCLIASSKKSADFRGPQSSEETPLRESAMLIEALRYSSLGVLCARSGDSSHSRAALTPQNVHWTFLGAA